MLAFVLGGIMETAVRQSLRIFGGDPTGFVLRPISGTLIAATVLLAVGIPLLSHYRKRRAVKKGEPENFLGVSLLAPDLSDVSTTRSPQAPTSSDQPGGQRRIHRKDDE